MGNEKFKTEHGISDCYLEGVLKHSGAISGFIYVFTQLFKSSEGDGRLIMSDVDEALARVLGELGAAGKPTVIRKRGRGGEATIPPPVEEMIAKAAESLADPNFFIAEISGVISALVELKIVCEHRREGLITDQKWPL